MPCRASRGRPDVLRGLALVTAVVLLAGAWLSSPSLARFTRARSAGANALTADVLNAPASLSATGGNDAALSWSATVDSYATGYQVLRATAPTGPYTQIATVTPRSQTTYTDSPTNGTYYYAVRSYYQSWTSASSSTATAVVARPVAFAAASNGDSLGDATSFSFSHTIGAGVYRALIVGVSLLSGSGQSATSVTYGGTPLTFIGVADRTGQVRAELWGMVNPPVGAATVQVQLSATTRASAGAISFTGVSQIAPWGLVFSNTGKSTSRSTVVSGVPAKGMAVDVVGVARDDFASTVGSGQVQRWSGMTTIGNGFQDFGAGSTEYSASGGNVTMSWTFSKNMDSALAAIALSPP